MQIIVKGKSRFAKQQRAAINYVDKKMREGAHYNDSRVQEAVKDVTRWGNESGLYKDKTPLEHRKNVEYNGTDTVNLKKEG